LNLYTHRIPAIFKWFFPEISWSKPTNPNTLYLTFDDGPTPEVTEFVLNELTKHHAKATFFCIGRNIENHSAIFEEIIAQGHSAGNHTYSHLNGWISNNLLYLEDIKQCKKVISEKLKNSRDLFRPPYGKIKISQLRKLKDDCEIVLWDYLVGDFDSNLSKEKCWEKAKRKIKNGDIVVFHDNKKSFDTLKFVLPKFLKHYADLGFEFKSL